MSSVVRINVFRSHEEVAKKTGKVVVVGSSLPETLQAVSMKYGEDLQQLHTCGGAVIDDLSVLRDWDIVIATVKDNSPQSSEPNSHQSPDLTPTPSPSASSSSAAPSPCTPPTSTPSTPELGSRETGGGGGAHKSSEPIDFTLRRTSSFPTPDAASRHDWVRLNVGGKTFATTRATLTSDPASMLARMFEPGWSSVTDASGAYLIDRSPDYFEPLLNFLRHGKLILNDGVNPQGILEEAKFFGLSKAIEPLEAMIQSEELSLSGHFTRKEFLRVLSVTSSSARLRCQGVNLEGVDLSNLDMRSINFKCANLRRCNFSRCDLSDCVFERADMYGANLDGAVIQGVHMPRVNLEGASLKGCIMDKTLGTQTNMEGANLKGTVFDNSQMNGVNLRLASLKGASLRSCNLRYAVMAGTDLENCDLTGCELRDANLRGSNLAGAVFDDIIAPLHMSQTVNVTVAAHQTPPLPQSQQQAQHLPTTQAQ